MIPKIIHYCWFGYGEKPEIVLKCIESWKKYMPGYNIVEWNEKNFDYSKCTYAQQAYETKKWAFVSDYARFDILRQYGGIYFDTDVELIKSIPADILNKSAFTCMEPSGKVSPGLIFGSEADTLFLNEMVNLYHNTSFLDNNGKPICKTVNLFVTEKLIQYGYVEKDIYQEVNSLVIYPSSIFCGFDLDIMEPNISENTISVHHYSGTWMDKSLKRKIQKILKKIFGIEGYKMTLKIINKMRGKANV